ncbi:MAG: type III-A CRISPR-associated protein Cas10/Csm1 [Nitrospirae bacterium]|nr:MAG: type III-A CRISPR-associated protein Cas10/Csm1 [Nitrospirota bacterium]
MEKEPVPTRLEVALGALLHDIGKFMQRAHRRDELPERSEAMDSTLCPVREHSRYSHKHVLWTDAFFDWIEARGLSFPAGVDANRVRHFASFHHAPERHPEPAMGWLSAEADRLASGLDRKPKEEEYEAAHGWTAFRRQPLACLFDQVDLGEGEARKNVYDLAPLEPGEALVPRPMEAWKREPGGMDYRSLWQGFESGFVRLCREGTGNPDLFLEGLLGLLERYAWAIPSSTMDLPDVSLFDHARVTAALAVAAHATLAAEGRLADAAHVKDRTAPRYRLVAGDLSGIQKAIFNLASEGVAGLARTLRARSFYLSAITDAAVVWLLAELELPSCCALQSAGGRFLLLAPADDRVEEKVEAVAGRIRRWLLQRYYGELALYLVVGAPFGGESFREGRFAEVVQEVGERLEEAKLSPPLPPEGPVLDWVQFRPATGESVFGACTVCGHRPAAHADERARRCAVCHEEARLGSFLPAARGLGWSLSPIEVREDGQRIARAVSFFGEGDEAPVHLAVYRRLPRVHHGLVRVEAFAWEEEGPVYRVRHLANHCPRFGDGEGGFSPEDPRLAGTASPDGQEAEAGQMLTFEQIGALAKVVDEDQRVRGKPFLAALKADVDNLGLIFSLGLRGGAGKGGRGSVSRYAALSRQLDLFFTGQLQARIRRRFPEVYTLYAGGDDLFLIGPWRKMVDLAREMNDAFRDYTGHNPNVHLSAAVELFRVHEPLRRIAERVEASLERAKGDVRRGRDRIALFGDVQPWNRLPALLEQGDRLSQWIRQRRRSGGREAGSSVAFVHRLFAYRDMARRVRDPDAEPRPGDYAWRAHLTYAIARNLLVQGRPRNPEELHFYERLRGDDGEALMAATIPLHIALYENRT